MTAQLLCLQASIDEGRGYGDRCYGDRLARLHQDRSYGDMLAQELHLRGGGAGLSGFSGGTGGLSFRDCGRRGGAGGFCVKLPTCALHQVTTDGCLSTLSRVTFCSVIALLLCLFTLALGHQVITDGMSPHATTLASCPRAP